MSTEPPVKDATEAGWRPAALPGVWRRSLVRHDDSRGSFAELWRASWAEGSVATPGSRMRQANLSRSQPRVLRGLHAHQRQTDLWVVADGQALVALVDLRPALDGRGQPAVEMIDAGPGDMVLIPEGVAHGFYARSPLTLIYFVTNEYDASDEHGFVWNDRDAAVPWPDPNPVLSPRDAAAPSLRELLARLRDESQASSTK